MFHPIHTRRDQSLSASMHGMMDGEYLTCGISSLSFDNTNDAASSTTNPMLTANPISLLDSEQSTSTVQKLTSQLKLLPSSPTSSGGVAFSSTSLISSSVGSNISSMNPSYGNATSTSSSANHVAEQGNQNAVVLSTEEALLKLSNRTKYPIVQENGQRCYGPPPDWEGPSPERGCEVFVGKIPRDCFEDELVPIFEKIGPIYMFRLMMDFNGSNRGYGFCMYTCREHAKLSVQKLDNYEIRTDKMLGVCQSVDNCRLFVGGIPKTKSKEEIFIEMSKVTEGVRDVIVYPSAADKSKNRGFAFVEYESHKSAAMARRKLIPGRIQLWGQQIAVDWAEPEREVDESIMCGVRVLYVRNLMLSTTEDTLREIFNKACDSNDAIERVKKMRDYAFVHFRERKLADLAMKRIHNTEIEGSRVEVSWAKPVDKSESASRSAVKNGSKSSSIPVIPSSTLMSMPFYMDPLLYPNLYATPTGATTQSLSLVQACPTPTNRQSGVRSGRVYRNAAGSRSAGSRSNIPGYQRDRKTPNELTQNSLMMPSTFVDMLEEVCHKNNWGTPAYSTAPQEVIDPSTGQMVTLHVGQVSIPGLNQYYMGPTFSSSPEEARHAAAKSVLTLFSLQMQLQTLDGNVPAAQTASCQATIPTQIYYPTATPGGVVNATSTTAFRTYYPTAPAAAAPTNAVSLTAPSVLHYPIPSAVSDFTNGSSTSIMYMNTNQNTASGGGGNAANNAANSMNSLSTMRQNSNASSSILSNQQAASPASVTNNTNMTQLSGPCVTSNAVNNGANSNGSTGGGSIQNTAMMNSMSLHANNATSNSMMMTALGSMGNSSNNCNMTSVGSGGTLQQTSSSVAMELVPHSMTSGTVIDCHHQQTAQYSSQHGPHPGLQYYASAQPSPGVPMTCYPASYQGASGPMNYSTLSLLQGVNSNHPSADPLGTAAGSVYFDATTGLVTPTPTGAMPGTNFLNISPMLAGGGDLFASNLCFANSGATPFSSLPQ